MIDLASALPVTPGGWGTGEAAAVHFFGLAAVAETMALATSVLFRLVALSMSLPGGLLLAFSTKSRDLARPALARG